MEPLVQEPLQRRVALEDLYEDPDELLMFMVNNDLPESEWKAGDWKEHLETHPREAATTVKVFTDWKERRLNGGHAHKTTGEAIAPVRGTSDEELARMAYEDDEKLEGEVSID